MIIIVIIIIIIIIIIILCSLFLELLKSILFEVFRPCPLFSCYLRR